MQIGSKARWQSGHAADCNSVNAGSIPTRASNLPLDVNHGLTYNHTVNFLSRLCAYSLIPAFFAGAACADDLPLALLAKPDTGYLPAFRAAVQRVANDPKVVGLAVAVIDGGELIYQHTSGETAIRSGNQITPNTLFRVASVSKTFTGTLLADLAETGLVDLNAPIPAEFLTVKGQRQPTLMEVATHRTGLPPNAYDNDLEAKVDVNRILQRLASVDLVCPVGDCHTYQNLTFATLGKVIEAATEMSFEEALRARLFGPLGMQTASVGTAALIASGNYAVPHRRAEARNNQYRPGDPATPYDGVAPAAAVNASLQDMVAWAFANLGLNPALSMQTLVFAHAWRTNTPSQNRALWRMRDRMGDTGYGLGWRNYLWEGRNLVTHSGYIAGYGAQILLDPERDFAFIALWNSDAGSPWYLWPTLLDLQTRGNGGTWLDEYGFRD